MNFAFTEEQETLRRMARRFLEETSSPGQVRAAMQSEAGYDLEVWSRIGQELGWPALIIPEAYGGYGFSYIDLVAVMEEMGRALLCAPYFSSVCLAANALLLGGDEAQKEEHLPGIAAGQTLATVAWTGPQGRWDARAVSAEYRRDGSDLLLSGVSTFVIDGHTASLLIVAARRPDTSGEDGVSLFLVPGDSPGLERRMLTTMDQTRRQAEIRLDRVRVPASSLMGGEGGGWEVLRRMLELASVALAAEQVGGAERCLELAVDYAKVRVQFGRAIGSFQAIKHKCADMLLQVESARSAAWYAGWAAACAPEELPVAAPLAKSYCSDAYFHCAAESLQIHGGIGFTWEHDAHLYFKRAKASQLMFGDASWHREIVAQRIGL